MVFLQRRVLYNFVILLSHMCIFAVKLASLPVSVGTHKHLSRTYSAFGGFEDTKDIRWASYIFWLAEVSPKTKLTLVSLRVIWAHTLVATEQLFLNRFLIFLWTINLIQTNDMSSCKSYIVKSILFDILVPPYIIRSVTFCYS